ncbi:hypothetical protein ScPMuIL_007910 [Solemya velum]
MKKIRLCDADVELFDLELSPSEFRFFQRHRDAFRCMWKEQDKPFWKRFIISFRSFTVKHGIIKQFSCDTPKFQNILDEAFIFIHEQFVDGKATTAKNFIEDTARLAQNQEKLQYLDSKSFAKDPFYISETREVFRSFFGPPNQKTSLLKVYILTPVYLRFGGSVCRCLDRWMHAISQDPNDESYWIPPRDKQCLATSTTENTNICTNCQEEFSEKFFKEKISGNPEGPKYVNFWLGGDPRFIDPKNPLFCLNSPRGSDWRLDITVPEFVKFCNYVMLTYTPDSEKCKLCMSMVGQTDMLPKKKKKKNKKKKTKCTGTTSGKVEVDAGHAQLKVDAASQTQFEISQVAETNTLDLKKGNRRRVFSSKARITDETKYGIAAGTNPGLPQNMRGSFKVFKIVEDDCMEMVVTVVSLKNDDKMKQSCGPGLPDSPLSGPFLRSKIEGLPEMFEWWESKRWCVSVFNYEKEERHLCAKPTNFSIKISGPDENSVKNNMLKFLYYVAQRKMRPCPGWVIEEDDVVACVFPGEYSDIRGIHFCIQKGFRFEERLTEEERASLEEASEPFLPKKKKILMTLETEDAKALLEDVNGRQKVKGLMKIINGGTKAEEELKLKTCNGVVSRADVRDQMDKLTETISEEEHEDYVWEQMEKNPETFGLFVLVDRDKLRELASYGLKALSLEDIRHHRGALRCNNCDQPKMQCQCSKLTSSDQPVKMDLTPEVNSPGTGLTESPLGSKSVDQPVKMDLASGVSSPYTSHTDGLVGTKSVDQLVRTALASKLDSPDNDNTEALLLEFFKPPKVNDSSDALPPLQEAASKATPVQETKSSDDLPPLVDYKSTKPIGRASVFPASNPSGNSKAGPITSNTNSAPGRGESGIALHFGNSPVGVRRGEGGVQIGINIAANHRISGEALGMKSAGANISITTSSGTASSPMAIPSQLNNCIVEAQSTINRFKTSSDSARAGPISVKVETRSMAGTGPGQINMLRQRIHSGIVNATSAPMPMPTEFDSEEMKASRYGRGTVLHLKQRNVQVKPGQDKTDTPQNKQPHIHHHIQVVHECREGVNVSGATPHTNQQTPPSLQVLAQSKMPRPISSHMEASTHQHCPKHHQQGGIISQPSCPIHSQPGSADQNHTCPKHQQQGAPGTQHTCPKHHTHQLQDGEHVLTSGQQTFHFKVTRSATPVGQNKSASAVQETTSTTVQDKPSTTKDKQDAAWKEKVVASRAESDIKNSLDESPINILVSDAGEITATVEPTSQSDVEYLKTDASSTGEMKADNDLSTKNKKRTPNLRSCANCGEQEPAPKTFKKCQKCKAESVANARYYCGRECQVVDWTEKHKSEHKNNLLN